MRWLILLVCAAAFQPHPLVPGRARELRGGGASRSRPLRGAWLAPEDDDNDAELGVAEVFRQRKGKLEARKADELLPYSVFDTTPPRPLIGRYALPQNTGNGDLLNLEGKTWTIRRVTHRKRYRGGRFELYAKIADVTEVSRAAQEEVLSRMLPDSD